MELGLYRVTAKAVTKLIAERHPELRLSQSSVQKIMRERLGYSYRRYDPATVRYNDP
jgi:hypothetical protein